METDGQNKVIVVELSANPLATIINWKINGRHPEIFGNHKIYTSPDDVCRINFVIKHKYL
jgi:hypothetical protein